MNSIDYQLKLSPDQMRSLGYRIVDQIIDHFENLPTKPVTRMAARVELEALLREPLPEHGADINGVLDLLQHGVWSNIMHLDHPRFFAFVPSPSNFVSAMADALVAGFNPFAGTWLEVSGPAQVEIVTVDWLRQICGLPPTGGGHFVTGGSTANLTALAVARHIKLSDKMENAVVYFSDQTHSSVERALRLLGFARDQMHKIPSDDTLRLSVSTLQQVIEKDQAEGYRPFCVVGNAGTTNTGAVDPLPELAGFCAREGLWLHVDASYGGAALLSQKGQEVLTGIERVDSLSLDPHKWLFQPYEIGCVLLRDVSLLRRTFHIQPEYLEDASRVDEEVNFYEYGIQLTRSFRALKLWLSLKIFGVAAFRQAIERGIKLAELAEQEIRRLPSWELVTPAQLGIVTFQFSAEDASATEINSINRRIVDEAIKDGFAFISSTTLKGRTVLRLCTINPRTTETDILETLHRLEQYGKRLRKSEKANAS